MMPVAPLAATDLRDVHAWAESIIADANGWAERAEVSRGERSVLTMHLDAIASRARHVASIADALEERDRATRGNTTQTKGTE
jgi:hypothetical protein